MAFSVLTINPGSTSTKVAKFIGEEALWNETIRHSNDDLAPFESVAEQFDFRLKTILEAVSSHENSDHPVDAVAGRGGIIDPLPGGTFRVDTALVERLSLGKPWDHASNLGGILADALGSRWNVPAFIVDPVCVDEMVPEAKIMGLPELPKPSFSHALNIKATVRRAARDMGVPWNAINCVVVHLGGGISIVAHRKGRIVDLNNANEYGPFSPERAGGLPVGAVARMCFSGQYTERDVKRKLASKGGLYAYLGTSDMREVRQRIDAGDDQAALLYRAMAWQIAKEISAQAVSMHAMPTAEASMNEKVDAILFTGGIAYDSPFIRLIQDRVQWIAPCLVYAGENEMLALAQGALRVLSGEEKAKHYSDWINKG